MSDSMRLSAAGMPRWFSPKHAAEKFEEISRNLSVLIDQLKAGRKVSATTLRLVKELADESARHYQSRSPVQSVRVMEPSGAIYVILADGREVVVPQPPTQEE